MNRFITILIFSVVFFCCPLSVSAQNEFGGIVKLDKTIHNFGDILLSDGELECTFKVTNISSKPIVIHNVITSCGCTNPTWTKAPIRPQESGNIDIAFLNDQGPYPFDKSITVYVSDLNKPIILRIRGVAHERKRSLKEMYPYQIGALALRKETIDIGQIEQGLSRFESEDVANLSSKPIRISFPRSDEGLVLTVTPNPVPANGKGVLSYSVDTKRTRGEKWGKTIFKSEVAINGMKQQKTINIETLIKENFTGYTDAQKKLSALPQFYKSSLDLGECKVGETRRFSFKFKNAGKQPLTIYKTDFSEEGMKCTRALPRDLQSGEEESIDISFTAPAKKGETLYIATIITNSPYRPIVNLFITVNIQ